MAWPTVTLFVFVFFVISRTASMHALSAGWGGNWLAFNGCGHETASLADCTIDDYCQADMASHLKAAGKALLNSPKALRRKLAGNDEAQHGSE